MSADLENRIEAAWEDRANVTSQSSDVREAVGAALTLLDSAEAMPDEAVKTVTSAGHYRAVRGVLANAMQLPFEGGRFDALCAMHMLYHLPDPAQALGEMR